MFSFARIYTEWVEGDENPPGENRDVRTTKREFSLRSNWVAFQRIRALLQKRLLYLWRTPFLFFIGWLLPLAAAYLGLVVVNLKPISLRPDDKHFNLAIKTFVGNSTPPFNTFLAIQFQGVASLNYERYMEKEGIPYDLLADVSETIQELYDDNAFTLMTTYAFGASFNESGYWLWSNRLSVIGQNVQRNMMDTIALRSLTRHDEATIHTGISLHTLTEKEMHGEDIFSRDPLNELYEHLSYTWMYWGVVAPVSFGLITSTFVVLPSLEIANEARDLQLMSGISGFGFLGVNLLFDIVFYLVPMLTIYAGFATYFKLPRSTKDALAAVLFSSAPVEVLLPYVISEFAPDGGTAYAINLGLFVIAAPGAVIGYLIASKALHAEILRWPLLLFPPFTLPAATVRAVNLATETTICDYLRGRNTLSNKHVRFCDTVKVYGPTVKLCCDILTNKTNGTWERVDAFSPSPRGIFVDVLVMLLLAYFLFVYILKRVSGWSMPPLWTTVPQRRAGTPEDEDVASERVAVEKICRRGQFAEYTFVARRLHKNYGALEAVRGISFALRPAECFGLLGVNGAGKTTTFRMLTGLTHVTYGDAYMRDARLSGDTRKWQSRLGYCPQSAALLEKLNAYEVLYVFGRLRGVREENLAAAVEHVIYVVGLGEHARKRCHTYSGGNKRKLCIGVALIGFPGVVFLDEPYAGVDVLSRTRIYERLDEVKESTKCTIVLTSHSMEECELSCDRMCIMVEGEMVCLGTLQHLKDKYGKGCRVQFVLPDDAKRSAREMADTIVPALPGASVSNLHSKKVELRIEEKLPWSTVFKRIAALEENLDFEYVLVSDYTLEQIFVDFARKKDEDKEMESEI
ncbi:hypothetical protein HPB50_005131 [Hyalomma asiaticum]|uniref:Uncharacterized protein n=1 Tax=Hyalomma asiaticum TaxID=266040 RepID=A0ACB7S713_HYAAI|nr:hypothetical protein HPB50_005131 [Hyalomma asiaticum]